MKNVTNVTFSGIPYAPQMFFLRCHGYRSVASVPLIIAKSGALTILRNVFI